MPLTESRLITTANHVIGEPAPCGVQICTKSLLGNVSDSTGAGTVSRFQEWHPAVRTMEARPGKIAIRTRRGPDPPFRPSAFGNASTTALLKSNASTVHYR